MVGVLINSLPPPPRPARRAGFAPGVAAAHSLAPALPSTPPQLSVYVAAKRAQVLPKQPGLNFCYDMLNRVSRSFAVVIQQLPEALRDAVCVFYLVLRALDTVEDDMALPDAVKVPLLRCFHEKSYDRCAARRPAAGAHTHRPWKPAPEPRTPSARGSLSP